MITKYQFTNIKPNQLTQTLPIPVKEQGFFTRAGVHADVDGKTFYLTLLTSDDKVRSFTCTLDMGVYDEEQNILKLYTQFGSIDNRKVVDFLHGWIGEAIEELEGVKIWAVEIVLAGIN